MSQVSSLTVMRHPLASKRYILIFRRDDDEWMEVFELLSRYEAVGPIGQGTYGYVCSARDMVLTEDFQLSPPDEYTSDELTSDEKQDIYDGATLVAVKKLRQLFENNQPRMWLCATREIQLMMSFQHANVMSATDFFIPLGGVESINYESISYLRQNFDSVYIVMKKMDYTLREVLDSIVVYQTDVEEARAEMAAAAGGDAHSEAVGQEDFSGSTPHGEGVSLADEPTSLPAAGGEPQAATAVSIMPASGDVTGGADAAVVEPPAEEAEEDALDVAIARHVCVTSRGWGSAATLAAPGVAVADSPTHSGGGGTNPLAVEEAGSREHSSSPVGGEGASSTDSGAEQPLRDPSTGLLLHPMRRDYRKFILYQILRGVGYMHRCPVIHRDLKPENVMLDRSYNTCVTDFGQGRDVGVLAGHGRGASAAPSHVSRAGTSPGVGVASSGTSHYPNSGGASAPVDEGSVMADYVQTVLDNTTQWYAAPETLTLAVATTGVGFIDHETFHGVDVWSIGCIAAEMMTGRPLFYTTSMGGIGQLISIMGLLGAPSSEVVSYICEFRDRQSRDIFHASITRIIAKFKHCRSTLRSVLVSPYGDEDPSEVELIARCLTWDPRERITIQEALESPFFVDEGYEPVIDPEDTAKRVPAVRPEDISEPVSGRAFLWELFEQRHPEVRELWKSLVRKHKEGELERTRRGGSN